MEESILSLLVNMVCINFMAEQKIQCFKGSTAKNGIVAVTVNSINIIPSF